MQVLSPISRLERPRAANSSISSSLAESTPPDPFLASSSIPLGMPTTTFSPFGSKSAARIAPIKCWVEALLIR